MKINAETFKQIKRLTRLHRTQTVARKTGLHPSTVINIRGCRNYVEYRELVRAEHPPLKYSLAADVLEIHRRVFEQPTIPYIPPKSAKLAMLELKKEIL